MKIFRLAVASMATLLVAASSASADGGKSIASAPTAVYGQQEFGNTANGQADPSSCSDLNSWWLLPVAAGDDITVDVEHHSAITWLRVYPVGTTDFTWRGARPTVESLWPADQKEINFTAEQSGVMPLLFNVNATCVQSRDPGPYDFTAIVNHGVRLSVPPTSRLSLGGAMTIGVHTPDGDAISDPALDVALQVLDASHHWTTVGHASPSSGTANVGYAIPSGLVRRMLQMRAVAAGPSYTTETSATQQVALPPALRLKLPTQQRISRTGSLNVSAVGYDGARPSDRKLRIVVDLLTPKGWKSIGSNWVDNAVAHVKLRLSRRYAGRRVALRAQVSGSYPSQTSVKRQYTVR